MVKITSCLLAAGLMTAPAASHIRTPLSQHAVQSQQGPHVVSRAAILIDARTGAILYEKNAFKQMDPASVTKMMTALLVIQHGHLSRTVTISRQAAYTVGSRLHIAPGQRYTVYDLLHGLLMRSGNDASVALAEADAGSVNKFVAKMNMSAQELGAFNTQFENPNGLTKPGHFSTAYDLALIARHAMRIPLFRKIVASKEAYVTELRGRHRRTLNNTNQLLYTFPGANGVKTGTTDAAGKCLVASATRNGEELIAVVLHSQDRYRDAMHLLEWGFGHWATIPVLEPGTAVAKAPVAGGQTPFVPLEPDRAVWLSLPNQETYHLTPTIKVLQAPVPRRQPAGFITVTTPGQPAVVTGLRTMQGDGVKAPRHPVWSWLKSLFSRGK